MNRVKKIGGKNYAIKNSVIAMCCAMDVQTNCLQTERTAKYLKHTKQ